MSVRTADGLELAALLSALRAQQHPAISRFDSDLAALEFLLDDCCIAVFEGVADVADEDSSAMLLMVMDSGPDYVSRARLDSAARLTQLAHTTVGEFLPYEAPSRHRSNLRPETTLAAAGPRAPQLEDLQDFLRMFRAAEEPFMRELRGDAARLAYLRDETRIAVFDRCKSGDYEGPLAFFLWPIELGLVTVAIRSGGRWRYAGGEFAGD